MLGPPVVRFIIGAIVVFPDGLTHGLPVVIRKYNAVVCNLQLLWLVGTADIVICPAQDSVLIRGSSYQSESGRRVGQTAAEAEDYRGKR